MSVPLGSASPPRVGSTSATGYTGALAVLTTVFFMWGFATVLNDILVPHLKAVFRLNYGQSLLIQFAFYLGYLLMAIPSAKLLERIGYKNSVVLGLLGMAASALVFLPAANLESYAVFLVALFLLASSITLLQVAANPYVTVIGPPQTASSRLNLVQAFNSAGTTLAPLFGGMLILARSSSGNSTVDSAAVATVLTAQQRAADVQAVRLPYLLIAGVLDRPGLAGVAGSSAGFGSGKPPGGARRARRPQSVASPQSGVRRARNMFVLALRNRHRVDPGEFHLLAEHRRYDSCRGGAVSCRSSGGAPW
jgi:FHS family L-fucose permease-like MFS transporter